MVVENVRTGARWRSANPASGVWQKIGATLVPHGESKPVGYVALGFYPFRKKHLHKFRVLA